MERFELAKSLITEQITHSANAIDPSHAENTLYWMSHLYPDADEILKLAALAHDIERSLPDSVQESDFGDYYAYKQEHAERGGRVASHIVLSAGYTEQEAQRLASIIKAAEFSSDDEDVQKVCDADSVSFFDNNIGHYIEVKGTERTKKKMHFMYDRASEKAKAVIQELMASRPELDLISLTKY